MLCAVYKSIKKQQTYLFVKSRDDFSDVPEPLKNIFGTPSLVTIINLATKDKLAMADINKVRESLLSDGYYLQLPPPKEDMLKAHKANMDNLNKSKEQLDD